MRVSIVGSTQNALACKGSDMDLTLLIDDYLAENRHKQVKLPKIVVKQLKASNGDKPPASVTTAADSSDSNMTAGEPVAESEQLLVDENMEGSGSASDGDDLTLKESIVKFFVSCSRCCGCDLLGGLLMQRCQSHTERQRLQELLQIGR